MKELNVTVANSANQVIRIGEAEKIYDPRHVEMYGDIYSPVSWVKNRFEIGGDLNKQSNVVFNHPESRITLTVNESDYFSKIITGTAAKNKFLASLKINNPDGYRRDNLLEVFKFARRYFKDEQNHKDFIAKIISFKATTNTTHEAVLDGSKGQSSQSVNSAVTSELTNTSITLHIAVLDGFPKQDITFNIETFDRNGSPMFFLICDEIDDIIENSTDAAFAKAEAVFAEYDIVCVHQRQ